jgi:hypothetical protein
MLQPKIAEVSPLPDYKLLLIYETNERKILGITYLIPQLSAVAENSY